MESDLVLHVFVYKNEVSDISMAFLGGRILPQTIILQIDGSELWTDHQQDVSLQKPTWLGTFATIKQSANVELNWV